MDEELETAGVRKIGVSTLGDDGKTNGPGVDASAAQNAGDLVNVDAQVLSSLLESLELENGQSGPVSNMFREMGIPLP